ncbi:MAG: ArsR/SmtB family transcription factor [Acidimicrobiales bacterium]
MDEDEANALAEMMSAFATASRLRILYGLLDGERSVAELAAATGLSATRISQQLRVLRHLRIVTVRRQGRHAHYRPYDEHVVDVLTTLRRHLRHDA